MELETWLLEAPAWQSIDAEHVERALREQPIMLEVGDLGLLPMRGIAPPTQRAAAAPVLGTGAIHDDR